MVVTVNRALHDLSSNWNVNLFNDHGEERAEAIAFEFDLTYVKP